MILYPAIDLMGGKAVRLKRGVRSACDCYGDAYAHALRFLEAGATHLHIVDLDAAFDGTCVNDAVIEKIAAIPGLTTELGGGNRDPKRVKHVLEDLGIARAIIGSAAVTQPQFCAQCVSEYKARVVLGLDALDGVLKIRGWVEDAAMTPLACAKRYHALGAEEIVYTDIARDGLLTGVNVQESARLQRESGMRVIASGGVRNIEDIRALQRAGVYGAILGRSLYEGTLDLREALALC